MNTSRTLAMAACASAIASLCLAQPPVKFTQYVSAAAQTPGNVYATDLNNDGITDVLQDTGLGSPGFTISYGQGNGYFRGAQTSPEPWSSGVGTSPLVTADFNNDGKNDIAAISYGSAGNQIAFYKGNPGFPFTSPKVSTINLPSGWHFGSGGAAAGDFNRDGKVDIVAWADNWDSGDEASTTTALYVMEGDGTGGFGNPHRVFTGPAASTDFKVFVGDFDADGTADIAADPYTQDFSTGNTSSTTVHVLYGNGDFTFNDTTPFIQNSAAIAWISSGDLNSDGLSDLVVLSGGYGIDQKLIFLYGETSRTFKTYSLNVPQGSTYILGASGATSDRYFPHFAVGDFNGDGHMDLVSYATDNRYTTGYLYFLLGTSTLGQYTSQVISLGASQKVSSNAVAGLFGGSHIKPDVALNLSENPGDPPYNSPSTIREATNTQSGAFGPCQYPRTGQGVNVCAAGTGSGTSRVFHASANSFGNLRKIELWVDGKKVAEQHHAWEHQAWFNYTHSFAAGTHNASLIAADVDNRLQKHKFSFTVQ